MWVKGRKAAKHTAMCIPMQLSCMFCTCTPKPKMQLKKRRKKNKIKNKFQKLIIRIEELKTMLNSQLRKVYCAKIRLLAGESAKTWDLDI